MAYATGEVPLEGDRVRVGSSSGTVVKVNRTRVVLAGRPDEVPDRGLRAGRASERLACVVYARWPARNLVAPETRTAPSREAEG